MNETAKRTIETLERNGYEVSEDDYFDRNPLGWFNKLYWLYKKGWTHEQLYSMDYMIKKVEKNDLK